MGAIIHAEAALILFFPNMAFIVISLLTSGIINAVNWKKRHRANICLIASLIALSANIPFVLSAAFLGGGFRLSIIAVPLSAVSAILPLLSAIAAKQLLAENNKKRDNVIFIFIITTLMISGVFATGIAFVSEHQAQVEARQAREAQEAQRAIALYISESDMIISEITGMTIAAGRHTSYAIREDGTLLAWGRHSRPRQVNGIREYDYSLIEVMEDAAVIAAGAEHTAAIETDGSLWAWGGGSAALRTHAPDAWGGSDPAKALEHATAVSAGARNTLVLRADGSLWELGRHPRKVMEDVVYVSAGNRLTMVIKADGSLWAWGQNGSGQLGDGTTEDRHSPVHILDDVVAVSTGDWHTMAIRTDGTLWVWGRNSDGQLGTTTRESQYSPVMVMENVVSVTSGGTNTMAIGSDGSLWAWGSNSFGQLGNGDRKPQDTPIRIMENIVSVSVSESHTMALKTDGSLWAWGLNDRGQLGDGTTTGPLADSRGRYVIRPNPIKIMDDIMLPR